MYFFLLLIRRLKRSDSLMIIIYTKSSTGNEKSSNHATNYEKVFEAPETILKRTKIFILHHMNNVHMYQSFYFCIKYVSNQSISHKNSLSYLYSSSWIFRSWYSYHQYRHQYKKECDNETKPEKIITKLTIYLTLATDELHIMWKKM